MDFASCAKQEFHKLGNKKWNLYFKLIQKVVLIMGCQGFLAKREILRCKYLLRGVKRYKNIEILIRTSNMYTIP
jgi:hypothetical protein